MCFSLAYNRFSIAKNARRFRVQLCVFANIIQRQQLNESSHRYIQTLEYNKREKAHVVFQLKSMYGAIYHSTYMSPSYY